MAIVRENEGTASPGGGSTTLDLTVTGVAVGEILVATVRAASGSAFTISPPSGSWVEVDQVTSGITQYAMFYFVADSTQETYTFTFSESASARGGGIVRYSGVDTGTVLDASSTTNTGASGTDRIGLSVTTVTDDAMLVLGVSWATNDTTFTPPSGMSSAWVITRNALTDEIISSSGATGNKTATGTDTSWITIMIALRPASAGPSFQPAWAVMANRSHVL